MKKYSITTLLILSLICYQCGSSLSEEKNDSNISIDFGNRVSVISSTLLDSMKIIPLETSNDNIIGTIEQIEVFEDKIYILDVSGVYVFSINGKYLQKLVSKGNGPGEFISPSSFWIDGKDASLLISDRQQDRLLKYRLNDLHFIESIPTPYVSPLSFCVNDEGLYIYFYPLRLDGIIKSKQIIVADKTGQIITSLLEGAPSGRILHGTFSNFYRQDHDIVMYPYFSNIIYSINDRTLSNRYRLYFGRYKFPDEELFLKYNNSSDVMKELLTGEPDYVRFMYVYETTTQLMVKYYIKRDLYIGFLDKSTQKTLNFKVKEIRDDLNIGTFPLPIGRHNNRFIGVINASDIGHAKMEKSVSGILSGYDITEDDNPLLVFYTVQ